MSTRWAGLYNPSVGLGWVVLDSLKKKLVRRNEVCFGSARLAHSEAKKVKGPLPEGFFDDKDVDLRARGITPVKPDGRCQKNQGLEYLQSHGTIHRDLKPSNILVNTKMEVKFCDFSDSKIMHGTLDPYNSYVDT
ncbi:Mitogen-activated protein kinase kinase 4-like [Forsythia ovata]|uniref:mitogen-activated protein kinase kinase n=1 Tax=Forsythia ovata TaxID=205694 RepID=A0ABD1WEL1_9LAMI